MNERLLEDINRSEPDDSTTCISDYENGNACELNNIPERSDLEDIPARLEGTIDRREVEVVRFSLDEIKSHFEESVDSIENEFEIAELLLETKGIECAEQIWKSQLLFLESAFDFFMHELNKFALTSMYDEVWPQTKEYEKINVPLKLVETVLKTGEPESWFLEHINESYKTNTMISRKGFKKQLELFGIKIADIALSVFSEKNEREAINQLYELLDSLYERRNYLVHQSNRRHEDATFYQAEVSRSVVEDYICFVKKLIDALICHATSL